MGDFCNVVAFERFGKVECDEPVGIIEWLCEAGKAGRFVHYVENQFPNWDTVCALEDALVDCRMEENFIFVVGNMKEDVEVNGWLEYEDCIIVPYGPKRQSSGSDVGLYSRDTFDKMEYVIHALSECADDSGMKLNKIAREISGKPISPSGVVG